MKKLTLTKILILVVLGLTSILAAKRPPIDGPNFTRIIDGPNRKIAKVIDGPNRRVGDDVLALIDGPNKRKVSGDVA